MAPTSIADRVAQCLGAFRSVAPAHSGMEHDESQEEIVTAITDELAREQVARLLDDLAKSLDEVEAILNGNATPWDEETGDDSELDAELREMLKDEVFEFGSELGQLSAEITDIIGSLLRLSMSMRNPAPHDHFMSTEYAKAKYFNEFDVRHVETKYKYASKDLARRLGAAISSRRQYFKYRESHHAKLSRGMDLDETCTEAGAKSTVASSVPLGMKDSGEPGPVAFNELDEDNRSDTGISETSYATTRPDSENLRVPPLPEQHSKGPFECPFCFMLISVTNRLQWKRHVLGDLRPYTCLFENCITADREYHRRHEWMEHVLQKHWKTWRCPASCEGSWSSEAGLKQHLHKLHADIASAEDLNAIIARSERKKPLDETTECQLCGETLASMKQYLRHVGKHQVDLALFALPKIDGGEDSGHDDIGDDSGDGTEDGEEMDEEDDGEDMAEEDDDIHTTRANLAYLDGLAKFHKQQGNNLHRLPYVDKKPLDMYRLKRAVESRGGFDNVCKLKKWAEVARDLGYSGKIMSSLSTSLKNSYLRWLHPYEEYLRLSKPGVRQQLEAEPGGPLRERANDEPEPSTSSQKSMSTEAGKLNQLPAEEGIDSMAGNETGTRESST